MCSILWDVRAYTHTDLCDCASWKGQDKEAITSSRTFSVKITAPAASSANATAKTSDWKMI